MAAAGSALSSVSPSFVLTLTSCNPLGKISDDTGLATVIAYDMPWIKDGYLATNSLIAMMILMARAYQPEDENFNSLMSIIDNEWINSRCQQLRDKDILQKLRPSCPLIILYGQTGRIAAIDLESKLAESSLSVCQMCDYRQFAHGRHLQFASSETPLTVAFSSSQDELLSAETIKLLATHVPILEIKLPEHTDAASRLTRLKDYAVKLWKDALSGKSKTALLKESRILQDEILENRRKNPPVYDFIFKRIRPKFEEQMNYAAEELAEEAKQILKI